MANKVCLVTGANSGIGKATALALANLGYCVVMVCRDQAKGKVAQAEIIAKSGNPLIELLTADLSLQAAIHHLVEEFKIKHSGLHILINNAGLNLSKRTLSEDGIEMTFAVNHFAPFLLTHLLLDSLKADAPARIINVTSDRHHSIDFRDLKRDLKYSQFRVYEESKMANILFTRELAKRLQGSGVTANCVAPGFVRTNLGRNTSGFFRLFLCIMRPVMQSPEQAAKALVHLATSPDLANMNGQYFDGEKETRASQESYDQTAIRQLWQMSEQLTHLPKELML